MGMGGLFRGQHPVNDSLRHHTPDLVRNTGVISNPAVPINDLPFLKSLKSTPVGRSCPEVRTFIIQLISPTVLPLALRTM